MPVRVAAVGYTNAWPLLTRLDRIRYQVTEGHPAQVAEWVRQGEADVGLVPVGALLSEGSWKVVPGACIGCEGPVHSVLLVAETPPGDWTEVLLDGVSRTSVVLAQLILRRGPLAKEGITFRHVEPGTAQGQARGTTAALVIGDAARNLPPRMEHRIDLGQAWYDWTGLPFVFAVWAGRNGLSPSDIAGLRQAATEGLDLRAALPEPDRTYLLEHIRYELDDRALMGLRRFAALGVEEGLLSRHEIELYGPGDRLMPRADLDRILDDAANGVTLHESEIAQLVRAPLADLSAAADLRCRDLHPQRERGYASTDHVDTNSALLRIREDEGDDERIWALLRLEALGGWTDVAVEGGSAAEALRWTALSRLLTTIPNVLAPLDLVDIGQAALHSGANDLGELDDIDRAERDIRQAGFVPQRRARP
ncbi:MAG TPA: MqnA/MqnD/SBP family protein [Myxococcota bacterium]|nr:MqnA/MqnD/SBP family protein [Myxococcota bacterium]